MNVICRDLSPKARELVEQLKKEEKEIKDHKRTKGPVDVVKEFMKSSERMN